MDLMVAVRQWILSNREILKSRIQAFVEVLSKFLQQLWRVSMAVWQVFRALVMAIDSVAKSVGGFTSVLSVLAGVIGLFALGRLGMAIFDVAKGFIAIGRAAVIAWRSALLGPVLIGAAIVAAFLVILLVPTATAAAQEDTYFPTGDRRTSTPEAQGMDSAQLLRFLETMTGVPNPFHSVVVIRHGYVVGQNMYTPRCKKGKDVAETLAKLLKEGREELDEHMNGATCRHKECQGLIRYRINVDKCTLCGECLTACKAFAVFGEKRKTFGAGYMPFRVRENRCTKCDACRVVCPEGAVDVLTGKQE